MNSSLIAALTARRRGGPFFLAPLTGGNGNDTVAPTASLSTAVPASISYGGSGATFTYTPGFSPGLTWTSAAKFDLTIPAYTGKKVRFSATIVSLGASIGGGTGSIQRLFTLNGPTQIGFSYQMRAGTNTLQVYDSTNGVVNIGAIAAGSLIEFEFDVANTIVSWFVNGTLITTFPNTRFFGTIPLQMTDNGGQGLTSITMSSITGLAY